MDGWSLGRQDVRGPRNTSPNQHHLHKALCLTLDSWHCHNQNFHSDLILTQHIHEPGALNHLFTDGWKHWRQEDEQLSTNISALRLILSKPGICIYETHTVFCLCTLCWNCIMMMYCQEFACHWCASVQRILNPFQLLNKRSHLLFPDARHRKGSRDWKRFPAGPVLAHEW